jgi:hypothetical protein
MIYLPVWCSRTLFRSCRTEQSTLWNRPATRTRRLVLTTEASCLTVVAVTVAAAVSGQLCRPVRARAQLHRRQSRPKVR